MKLSSQTLLNKSNTESYDGEIHHGNVSLISLAQSLGLAGPFKKKTHWKVVDQEGIELIMAGGYGALPFGIRHPDMNNFIKDYFDSQDDLSFSQHSFSKWRGALSSRLISILASEDESHKSSRVFYSNSGTEAVEVAIKFAKFYRPKAKYIINFTGAYHGKSYASLSLTPNPAYQEPFKPLMPNVITVPYNNPQAFTAAVHEHGTENIVAVILEPIQGDAGVIRPNEIFFKTVGDTCQESNVLLIADEILTGLGRCGSWFSSISMANLSPDIIMLAKHLSGGIVPIGATLVRDEIFQKMLSGVNSKIQSSTFGGGGLAMAVALKSIEMIEENSLVNRAKELGNIAKSRFDSLKKDYPELIHSVNVEGMLWSIHFQQIESNETGDEETISLNQIVGMAAMVGLHQHGVMVVTSLGNSPHIRLMPPLNIPEDIFDELIKRIERFARNIRSVEALCESFAEYQK